MNWDKLKKNWKSHIIQVSNKKTANETLVSWNGCLLMKYEPVSRRAFFIQKIQQPRTLVDYKGKVLGQEWPLKSKLKL